MQPLASEAFSGSGCHCCQQGEPWDAEPSAGFSAPSCGCARPRSLRGKGRPCPVGPSALGMLVAAQPQALGEGGGMLIFFTA